MARADLVQYERILKALANRRRLAIVRYLKRKKHAVVGEIADEIKLSFKATSKHLGVLYAAEIVEREQQSLQMVYQLAHNLHLTAKHISNSLE